ncbi:MAG TPA: DUF4388 domain-containing protein [Planctomycetota bacterium]|nr:DUF4388 domain-containing protein [Planctomycetota bacterium]
MGLKGNLSTVSLAQVFQALSSGNSSGLLRIQAPEGPRFVEILDGAISVAGRSSERIMLGDLLLSRGLLEESKLEEALQAQKESGKMLGQVLLDSGVIGLEHLEEALRFQIEEEVCELFILKQGEFDFLANATLDAKIAPGGGLVRLKIDPNTLLIEAARRADEWKNIEGRIPSQALLFKLTDAGRQVLESGEGISTEGAILLKLIDDRRSVESMVQKACLGRLTTNQMLVELWDAGFIELLPLAEYEEVSRGHLKERRFDEALRIANLFLSTANEEKNAEKIAKAQALVQDVEKAKKLAAQASSVKVAADPKVRSEVIRRAQAGVILKKERSSAPYVIAATVVVVLAAGAFFVFSKSDKTTDADARRNLESALTQSNDLITAGDYAAGLKVLQDFKTSNGEVQKQASEAYNKKVRFVEEIILKAIENFDAAYTENKPAELKAAAEKLEKLMDIGVSDADILAQRTQVGEKLARYKAGLKSGKFQSRLQEIQKNAKSKGPDETEQALLALLADGPPEEVAAPAREDAGKLARARLEAKRTLALAERIRRDGHVDAARMEYERVKEIAPGSKLAAEADKGLSALSDHAEKVKTQITAIEAQLAQKKTDDARAALLTLLQGAVPAQFQMRALDLYQTITPEDASVDKAISEAQKLFESKPAEARSALLKAVEKAPFSKAAARATLPTQINSWPAGAEILVDGQPLGRTPAVVPLPAHGRYALTLKKEGYHTTTLYHTNFRDEAVSARLNRAPSGAARMPAPARGAMIADPGLDGDRLLLLCGGELCVATRPELKVQKRIRLPGLEAALGPGVPVASSDRVQAVVSAADKALMLVPLTGAAAAKWFLNDAPISAPLLFNSDQMTDTRLAAVATQSGVEIWNVATGAMHKRISGVQQEEPAAVSALNDQVVVARRDSVLAVSASSGERQWLADVAKLSGGLARLQNVLAVVNTDGKVTFLAAKDGKVKSTVELKGAPLFGAQAAGDEVLVAMKGGRLDLAAPDAAEPRWSAALGGEISVQPAVDTARKTIAACSMEENEHYVNVIGLADGKLLYRGLLPSRPVSVAVDGRRVYVSTDDGDVTVFE